MKFTKDDACKHITSKFSEKGHTLYISERSINEMLDTLMPLLANDETELDDFVTNVLPAFTTANMNIKNDVSVGIKEYKEKNPIQKTAPTPVVEKKEDDPNAELLKRIEELEKRNEANEKKATIAKRRNEVTTKLNEKGCKDNEWIDSLLEEVSLEGDEFDAEARAEKYIKMYNKSNAKAPKNVTPQNPKGEVGEAYLNEVLKQAGEKNKALNGSWGQE